MKRCEKSRSLLYLHYQGKPETGTNSQAVLLKKNYLPTRNQNPPIAAIGCSTSDSISVLHKRHTQCFGKDTCAQLEGWDVTKLRMVASSCSHDVSDGTIYRAATRATCNQSQLFARVWKARSLVSDSSCLLLWFCVCPSFSPPTQVTSLPSAKEAEEGEGALLFSSNDKTAAAHRSSGVVTHRCYSSNRWPVKESALQSHLHSTSIFYVFLHLFQCVFGSGQ